MHLGQNDADQLTAIIEQVVRREIAKLQVSVEVVDDIYISDIVKSIRVTLSHDGKYVDSDKEVLEEAVDF